jgi:hypothetical protein
VYTFIWFGNTESSSVVFLPKSARNYLKVRAQNLESDWTNE